MYTSLDKNIDVENPVLLPSGIHFRNYCLDDNNEKRIQTILDTLFDPHQSLPVTIEKHLTTIKSYLSGELSFEEFLRKYNNSVLCGFVWTNATISYRCRTCATNPCMSLCPDCFHNGNHQGHDANMFRSIGGGICDCGDITVMNSNSFCKNHGPNRIPNARIPYKLIRCVQILLPRLILRFIQHLRSHASPIKSNTYSTIEEFTSLTSLFDLFDDLSNAGSCIRLIFTDCLFNMELYEKFNAQSSIDDLSNISYDVYLQQLNEIPSLLMPISLRKDNSSVYFHIKKATCLLDEILFWLVKYQIPERLLKFLLILLTDLNFKSLCIRSFLNIYGMVIDRLIHCRNSRERINSSQFVHISVQLFSNTDITVQAIKDYHLIELILSSLYSIFSNIQINCQLQKSKENYHLVIYEIDFSKNMHYWPIISDFINILSHEYASREFLLEKRFFITWIKMISWFQGMNVNQHEIESEILLQSNTNYLFAFTMETECCAMVLWTIITHIMKPDFLDITMKAINYLFLEVKQWFSSIGFEQYKDIMKNQVTFHIPLHRYISILTYVSLNYQNGELRTLFPIENEIFLLNLAIFPLRIQVVKYEILTNILWSYHNYEMQIQSDIYSSTRGNICSYMNDADIFLLQVLIKMKYQLIICLFLADIDFSECFYVHEWLVQNTANNLIFEKSSYVTLLEGSLIVLATIVAFSPHLALDDFERRRAEIINALAIQDCHYSYLDEHIGEPKGFAISKHDIQSIVDDIAEYISPTIDITNQPKQGRYKLKDFLWEDEFDPLHVLSRINRRDLFETTMQRYTKWVISMNKFSYEKNLWPPYRLYKPKDQFQTNLRCILQSRYLHGVFFSICHWMLNETIIHESILSLLVYLCELAIDDQIRRLKYGEFLNGYAPSTIEPPQCQNNSEINQSISLETLTSLEDENIDEYQQQEQPIEMSETESTSFRVNIHEDDKNVHTINIKEPSNLIHVSNSNSKINSCRKNDKREYLNEIEQCYNRGAIKFNQISEYEQQIQKQWDELIKTKDSSLHNQISHSIPFYDLENQFIRSDSLISQHCQNNYDKEEQENTHPRIENKKEKTEGIIDGKYETFYEQDNLLINAHTIIEKISFEQVILDIENDTIKSIFKEESNKEKSCTNIQLNQPSINFSTVSIQTNSKYITETKYINMSLIQMLVHLLSKIVLNINDMNNNKTSLSHLLDKARMKKGSESIGNGTVYLARLLVKLERLCDECKIQISETVNQLDHNQTNNNIDSINKKTKAKAMQQKIFEDIAKKQRKLLTASNDEHQEEILTSDDKDNNVECCICQSKDDQNLLGLVVRLIDTGVLGIREVSNISDSYLPLSIDNSNNVESSLKDLLTCCHFSNKPNDKQQSFAIEKPGTIYQKYKHKNDLTCAQFYEDKIHAMLQIFSEESVLKSITISWRTGVIINSCGHSIHLSCYEQYLKSHIKKINSKIDLYNEFKCPMCRQISNALIYTPIISKQNELNENLIDSITNLIEKNVKPCISPPIAEWLINFIQKMYMMTNKNQRTIDKHKKELNNDITELFIVSILRFNLENDLLIRDTEHIDTTIINRKSCFRELFYICSLQYPYLLNDSHISLWRRITGLMDTKLENDDHDTTTIIYKRTVPLLLSDPVALLLRIMLSLSYSITKEFYRIIVQAILNLAYIQALFTIVSEMNTIEQEIWNNIQTNKSEHNMVKYLRIISFKLLQANFNSNTDDSKVWSLESINASIHERCGNFIKVAALIQHHLYQPITWWFPGRQFQFDVLWKNLIRELQLYDVGEPYWFCNDSLSLIVNWLDEVFLIDKQHSIFVRHIARAIPLFDPPRFIDLPGCYSDLFQSCNRLHCSYCRTLITEPILCLICGIVYSHEGSETKCCNQQTHSINEHLISCNNGLHISININSTKTLIQRKQRYTYWASLYLDKHGEEDSNLRRGRILFLNENRLKLLYSAWISTNLDQLTNRWSTDQYDF
ncbi:unnamed protein product [Rotaria sordida]|uniref:E3 ubiquitin-protein ligase n=1 Tax=Rotaria sordida TaxID=392033 RepID=A0A819MC72_9BILA|nr:unnamed protein product [Rotaria sordida]